MKPHEKPEAKPEMKKTCACGPECDCGCNEGKECRCGCGCGCHCDKGCRCKSCGAKLIGLLIIFLAGMGFNELLHGCFGRCPAKRMQPAPMMAAAHHKMPHFTDGAGTVIIINADGSTDVRHGDKCDCHKHHNGMKPHHKHHGMPHQQKNETPFAEPVKAE